MRVKTKKPFQVTTCYIVNYDSNIEELNVIESETGRQYAIREQWDDDNSEQWLELEDLDGLNVYESPEQIFIKEKDFEIQKIAKAKIRIADIEKAKAKWLKESGKS